ncbi:hypothetical protein M569_14458, partial [Genlisea aurea]
GVQDTTMWRLMSTVDLLKHGIPDPSSAAHSHPHGSDKPLDEFMATPVFVHNRVHEEDSTPTNFVRMNRMLAQCFSNDSCAKTDSENRFKLFHIPYKGRRNSSRPAPQYESYNSALWKLRDQILSMTCPAYSRSVSERDWLKNSSKIWGLIKSSPVMADYCRMLQTSAVHER